MIQLHDLHFAPFISERRIRTRVLALAQTLTAQLADKKPLFMPILNGAFVFAADLMRHFEGACEVRFVRLQSYVGEKSSGEVRFADIGLSKEMIAGRHLVVVEDIVDSGQTLHFFLDYLRQLEPGSLTTVALLRKPSAVKFDISLDFVGFDIADKFVVGYGLDYDGLGRNLRGIFMKND